MPKKSKEETIKNDETSIKKATKSTNKVANPKEATTKKSTTKKGTSIKATSKKVATTKKTPSKEVENTTEITTSTSTSSKKKISSTSKSKVSATKTTKAKKATSKSSKTSKTATKTSRVKKSTSKKVEILEYYDLPYRYNETIVKILAQTPTTLFVYWDISDSDKEQYIKHYGTYFFNNTKPVLVVHNKTKNYSFEVDINDFANSWYLHILDGSNCDFQVELGRRPINNYVEIANNYLYITTSNDIVSQNDHILIDKLSHIVYFRNVKTNRTYGKNISNFTLLQKIGKFDINFIKEFYKKLYPNENISFDKLDLRNPSSGNPTSTFK